MKIKEFTAKIEKAIVKHSINQFIADDYAEYSFYGLRFENKEHEIGEVCENSRHNPDREDEREFPEFGSDEYEEMIELDGTSAWHISEDGRFSKDVYTGEWQSEDDRLIAVTDHCYIVAGDVEGSHDSPDQGEILICDAVVIEKLF
jgi:hypothetical protein